MAILKDLLPIKRKNRAEAGLLNRTVRSSTAYSGACGMVRRGAQVRKLEHHLWPVQAVTGKGYDVDDIRSDLAEWVIDPVLPGRSNRRMKIQHDRTLYKQRNRIEHMYGHF